MRKIILLLGLLVSSAAFAQQGPKTQYYDKYMNPRDSSRQEGDRYVTRDRQGNALGYQDSQGVYRDMQGNRLGSAKTSR